MSKAIEQQLSRLSDQERAQLERFAKTAGMTMKEWLEYAQKAQIYRNAKEVLKTKPAA